MANKAQNDFNPNTFARRTSQNILADYLHINHADGAVQEQILPDSYENNFAEVYTNLSENAQEDLSLVNDIATEKGMPHLLEACTRYNIELDINSLVPHDLALSLLNANRDAFMEAYNWYGISLMENYKDYKGKKLKEPTEIHLNSFKREFIDYLREQARGHQIHIDIYKKEDRIAYIIHYGDYLKNYEIFEKGDFVTVKQRLAKAITLIYYPSRATLRVKSPTLKLGRLARGLFAKYILDDENFFGDSYKHKFFNLNQLKEMEEADFLTHPADNIGEVTVKEVHAYLNADITSKIIIKYPDNLCKICEERNIDKDSIEVYKAKIKFKFLNAGRSNSKTYELTEPNISNLNDSFRDTLIKQYFKKWELLRE